jgi:predicted ribosome quality control (RQC) complex YloA/Tae2 family protein
LIEGILTEELRLKLQQQKDLYTRIRERDDNDFLDLEGHGRTKISMIKGKLDEIFADNLPGEEPICEEICNYYEETQTIKDAEKALEDIGVSDSVHFFPPKGSDFSEDLEEEISKVRNIIEEYKTKNAELDKEKEKISEEVQELTLKEQCVSSSCSRMKEEMDHKQKEVTNKIEGLLELSEGYSPCGEIIEEIKRRIIPLHSLEEPEEIKKHFEEIYRRLKFLQTALERAEPWLRERKKRKM